MATKALRGWGQVASVMFASLKGFQLKKKRITKQNSIGSLIIYKFLLLLIFFLL